MKNTEIHIINELIPMRDGTQLPTHIYLPDKQMNTFPCILIRTPYDKEKFAACYGNTFANWGYVIAIQEMRCRAHPKQAPIPYVHDGWGLAQDGYDTVEWLGQSKYTNGRIATFGPSAMGINQLLLAPTNPSCLICQYVQVATPSLYYHGVFVGGQFCKNQVEIWSNANAPVALKKILEYPDYNQFWGSIEANTQFNNIHVPILHSGGWYDIFSQGTIDSFTALQYHESAGSKNKQKLILGPWKHRGPDEEFGDFSYPEAAKEFNENHYIKAWFDLHLKNIPAPYFDDANVYYYVMGPFDQSPSKGNCWKKNRDWPIPCQETAFYLSEKSLLSLNKPSQSTQYTYQYDPENPTPTIGGRNLYLEAGPKDQQTNELRDDVISFTSHELEQDTEVTGRIKAHIYFSTDVTDTDVTINLTDLYPDGKSILITEGIARLGMRYPEYTQKQIVEVEVDLWSTSIVFAKGHRIRINISSSNYPHFERNLNRRDSSITHTVIGHNCLHIASQYPSRILLPII